jgi:hypothetical protein
MWSLPLPPSAVSGQLTSAVLHSSHIKFAIKFTFPLLTIMDELL